MENSAVRGQKILVNAILNAETVRFSISICSGVIIKIGTMYFCMYSQFQQQFGIPNRYLGKFWDEIAFEFQEPIAYVILLRPTKKFSVQNLHSKPELQKIELTFSNGIAVLVELQSKSSRLSRLPSYCKNVKKWLRKYSTLRFFTLSFFGELKWIM